MPTLRRPQDKQPPTPSEGGRQPEWKLPPETVVSQPDFGVANLMIGDRIIEHCDCDHEIAKIRADNAAEIRAHLEEHSKRCEEVKKQEAELRERARKLASAPFTAVGPEAR